MDRFNAMRAFVRVAETGSFSKAALTLHMSRSTVTQLVQQLEVHLRVTLLNRTTRQVNVTEDGAVYFDRIAGLLAELDEIEHSLPGTTAAPRGRLRVDVPAPLAALLLVPALPDFHRQFPEVQINMGASDRKVDLIAENVDCVIRGGDITDQSLVARQIGQLSLGVYAAPTYLARSGVPKHPAELEASHHRIVRFQWASSRGEFPYAMRRGSEHLRIAGTHVLAIDDGNAYLAAGVAGLGILWLPDYMAKRHVATGELIPLFTGWEIDPMPLSIAFPRHRQMSKKLRVFIDWVIALMGRDAPIPSQPTIAGTRG